MPSFFFFLNLFENTCMCLPCVSSIMAIAIALWAILHCQDLSQAPSDSLFSPGDYPRLAVPLLEECRGFISYLQSALVGWCERCSWYLKPHECISLSTFWPISFVTYLSTFALICLTFIKTGKGCHMPRTDRTHW